VPFGAFAEILPNVDGLIHVSQLDVKRITNAASVVKIGQEIEAKVMSVDWNN
jgi:ribosomal protein S1